MDTDFAPPQSEHLPVRRRPLSVTFLALGVLTLAGFNLLRFVVSLQQREFLDSLLTVHPLYITATGLVWAVVGFALTWGLWFGKGWSVRGTQAAALLYSLYFWLDRLLVASNDSRYNWPFAGIVNVLLVVLIFWILSNRKAKAFFGAMHG
jgi:hypothetical protein